MILPENYKEIKNLSGIYIIINIFDLKFYIGYALKFETRWNDHSNLLEKNKHDNPYLQNAYNKYGNESFGFSVLELVENPELLPIKEKEYLDIFFDNQEICYNICREGNSRIGIPHTEETKKKISATLTGKPFSKKHKENISKAHLGKIHSKEQNENYGNSRAKTYDIKLMSPTGEIFESIFNLRKFCRDHNLNQGNFWCFITKNNRDSYMGWKILKS